MYFLLSKAILCLGVHMHGNNRMYAYVNTDSAVCAARMHRMFGLVSLMPSAGLLQDAVDLCQALKTNTCLSELSCSSHKLSAATAAAIADMLAANGTLQSLSIGDSAFGDEELEQICKVYGCFKFVQCTLFDAEHFCSTCRLIALVAEPCAFSVKVTQPSTLPLIVNTATSISSVILHVVRVWVAGRLSHCGMLCAGAGPKPIFDSA